jgi:hypothetical protein
MKVLNPLAVGNIGLSAAAEGFVSTRI